MDTTGACLGIAGSVDTAQDFLRFIHTDSFARKWAKLGLTDDDLRKLESTIMLGPKHAPVVRGTAGMRKIRFGQHGTARGKRGAFRIYYGYFDSYGIVLFATVFGKNEADDLTIAGKMIMSRLMTEIEYQLEKGLIL